MKVFKTLFLTILFIIVYVEGKGELSSTKDIIAKEQVVKDDIKLVNSRDKRPPIGITFNLKYSKITI